MSKHKRHRKAGPPTAAPSAEMIASAVTNLIALADELVGRLEAVATGILERVDVVAGGGEVDQDATAVAAELAEGEAWLRDAIVQADTMVGGLRKAVDGAQLEPVLVDRLEARLDALHAGLDTSIPGQVVH